MCVQAAVTVKTIAGEEIARQHKIVVCDMEMKPVKKQKAPWKSRIKVWRLKENEVKEKYENTLKNASMYAEGDANKKWENMKEIMINAAEDACGKTKGSPRHQETWWWNEEVESFVDRKRECYQEWYKAKERKKNEAKLPGKGHLCQMELQCQK